MSETDVALELFIRWLNERHTPPFRILARTPTGATGLAGSMNLAMDVHPLLGPPEDEAWVGARNRLQAQLSAAVPGPFALWVPAGARLPVDEPDVSGFIDNVRQAAVRLGPLERGHVALPITLHLRKTSDDGGVMSVAGGMNPHWARFTDLVRGTYDLDSSALHRLPDGEKHLEQLIRLIAERAGELRQGERARIETIDAWTIQRLSGSPGFSIVAAPPGQALEIGLTTRRNLRRVLTGARESLRSARANLRALVLVGHYARLEQEGATTAMRGYDPALYAGTDFICLVADALVKPLIQPAGF